MTALYMAIVVGLMAFAALIFTAVILVAHEARKRKFRQTISDVEEFIEMKLYKLKIESPEKIEFIERVVDHQVSSCGKWLMIKLDDREISGFTTIARKMVSITKFSVHMQDVSFEN